MDYVHFMPCLSQDLPLANNFPVFVAYSLVILVTCLCTVTDCVHFMPLSISGQSGETLRVTSGVYRIGSVVLLVSNLDFISDTILVESNQLLYEWMVLVRI